MSHPKEQQSYNNGIPKIFIYFDSHTSINVVYLRLMLGIRITTTFQNPSAIILNIVSRTSYSISNLIKGNTLLARLVFCSFDTVTQ